MKKVVLVMLLTVLGFANANAQDIKFGAKGGLNFATLTGDDSSDLDYVTAFHVGVLAEIPFTEKFSFQPELLFSGQGYSVGDDLVALNYLNLPLMAKYYVMNGLSLEAGPQIGFLLSADNEGTDVKDSFKAVDFGVNVGVGYKLKNGLNFGLRYNQGLSNINDVDGGSFKNKNSVMQVSVGYFFF